MPVNPVSSSSGHRAMAPPPPPTLKKGSKGAAVEQLQSLLTQAGYRCAVDGDFGPKTADAVRRFQRAHGLAVDGVVGPKTWAALRSAQAPSEAPPTSPATSDFSSSAPALTRVLRTGCKGDDVEHLQGMLQEAGFDPGPADGVFGAKTARAVRAYQESRGLGVDGIVHQQTWSALTSKAPARTTPEAPPQAGPSSVTLAPRSASESEKYAHYANLVRQAGGQVCANGKATVLGIRGMTLDGTRHASTSSRSYDDVFVVLTPEGRCYELRGATHPGQKSSGAAPDVTRDGSGDVGTIRPGNYSVVPNGKYKGNTSYHVRTLGGSGSIPGWRDTNHDGRFTDTEKASSERRGDKLTGVLFHPGNTSSPSSIGCQTLSPSDYARFISAVGGANAGFSYTLIEA